ncbi:nuclease-related domain-containing protein [Sporosarcina luteola]|uniref:nuclease-related domain-containing protein n=1 Tax=Sporosarcina luteola TaxID=582850 RepID=UPI00203D4DCF|nr:nuclease-related domain-containing protein [Sporosarcina luteola]MCM3709226.1 NERD domain-containing protein [Sporosarcina luteola]
MLYKKRNEPLAMLGLQALVKRLPEGHPQFPRVVEDLRKRKAGFAGEENFDRHIREFRPSYPHGLLHDVCLNHDGVFFQMDSVLITPARIIIFEVKNLAGKIVVKENPTQFIQENNGERKVLQSPITELDRKKIFLTRWLAERGVDVPVEGVLGLAFTNELFIDGVPDTTIAFTHEIPILLYNSAVEGEKWGRKEISKVANEIVKGHREYDPFPLARIMGITENDILPGVFCPNCNRRGMKWIQKYWRCPTCSFQALDCHLQLINDWFYLIDEKITNGNFRRFAGIEDRHVSKRLLRKSGLLMEGSRKGTIYFRETP